MKMRGRRNKNAALIIIGAAAATILITYLCVGLFYRSHVFPNTVLGEIKLSNSTAADAEASINGILEDYKLIIRERGGVSEEINAKDIDLKYALEGYGEQLLSEQNMFAWPYHLFKDTVIEADFDITYSEELLSAAIDKLACMQQANIVMPEDAHISDYRSGEGFCIIDEVMGTLIDRAKFAELIKNALVQIESEAGVEEAGCYIDPEVYASDSELISEAEYLNTFTATRITYHFGDVEEVINGDTVYSWMKIKKNGKVKIDETKVKAFVDNLGSHYDTIFRPRTFMTTYGSEVTLDKGDYGWWMDRSTEVKELIKLVSKGTVGDREPVYFQKAAQYGSMDYGNTYVEVNLTAQHLFLYKDGKVILESDFVSGKETKDRRTEAGVYGVTYKERDSTLTGDDYETPVSYWMPFNGSIGLHDATWRNKFGSNFYKANGSHGCVNLPFYVAQKIYDNIEKGTPVICYRLPGTESTSVTPQGDEEIAQFVVDAIERIGKFDKSRLKEIEENFKRIRDCYKELTGNQKKYVTNLDKLDKAEKDFKEFKKEL